MRETLKMMECILNGKESEVDEKELIQQYKQRLLPNILAYFFKSNFNIICRTNILYPILDEEDKASFCLQEMDKCLQNFDITQNVKFITYFLTCYKNRLRMETEQLLVHKRKALVNYINLENEEIILNNDIVFDDLELVLNSYNLTESEKKQCKLLNAGYSLKEIADIFKQATITIYERNSRIKQKILNSNINYA